MIKKLINTLIFAAAFSSVIGQNLPGSFALHGSGLKKQINTSSESLLSNSITDILIVGDTIWRCTTKGLSKSTDNGVSWENFNETADFSDEGIVSIGYWKNSIWVTLGHTEQILGNDVQTGGGILFSTDNGTNWTKISQPVDAPGDSLITYGINTIRALPVTVSQQNISYGMSFTSDAVWIASWAGGFRRSTDFGATWKRTVLPPDNLDSIKPTDSLKFSLQGVAGKFGPEEHLNHLAFSVLCVNDTLIFAGTAGGVNRSTDGGISWEKFNHINTDGNITGDWVTNLSYDSASKSLWAASWKANGASEYYGASATYNFGDTWEPFLADDKVYDFGFSGGAARDVIAATGGGLFRAELGSGLWLSPGRIIDRNTNLEIFTSTFYSVESRIENNTSELWIGTAGDGLVKFTELSRPWHGDWSVMLSSTKLPSSSETYAFPNPFSPDQESVRIKYTLNSNGNVTVRIFDFGMSLVKTLVQIAQRSGPGEQFEYWNGRDEYGGIVPNGVYFYSVDSDQGTVYGKIMVLR